MQNRKMFYSTVSLLALVAVMTFVAGCSDEKKADTSTPSAPSTPAADATPGVAGPPPPPPGPQGGGAGFDPKPFKGNGKVVKTKSGLQYEDMTIGKGAEAVPGKTCVMHYTGTLTDGTKFDSSRDRNEPFDFDLGAGRVIKGWDEGVAGMKVGGRRKLTIPSDLGYGGWWSATDNPTESDSHLRCRTNGRQIDKVQVLPANIRWEDLF